MIAGRFLSTYSKNIIGKDQVWNTFWINFPKSGPVFRRFIWKLPRIKQHHAPALEDLESVVELEPENADARHKLAEILYLGLSRGWD